LGLNPISSVIEMLEDNFIKVVEVDEPLDFDCLSSFVDDKIPVVVVNRNFPVERKRFTLLHELGYLLLSFNQNFTEKEIEVACNRFAGAILIPQSKMVAEFNPLRKGFYLQELIEIQKEWGISIQAFICRAKDLEIITQSKFSNFFFDSRTKTQFRNVVYESRFAFPETSYRFNQLL
jgi:Zn-dependent peptidase ImmA (M78 family)